MKNINDYFTCREIADFTFAIASHNEIQKLSLARQIRILRESLKLTRKQFAKQIGITQQSIARIENGKEFPRFDVLQNIIGALGMQLKIEIIPKIPRIQ